MKQFLTLTFLTLLLNLAITQSGHAQDYTIDRVEPLNWWVGMENPELQIMMHGENIGNLTAEINYAGVTIERVVHVENDNYLFIYLDISHNTKPGSFKIKLLKGNKQQFSYAYELKKRDEHSAMREGFNSSDVIYLVTPDRFANGNPNNDEVKGYSDGINHRDYYGRHGGDIQGIIDHLDYIQKMGFTALWLNPVLENAMPNSSYHGYAITDYYKVDPRFGSNALYKKLSTEASKRGIKLIMDMVTNHVGAQHWWVKDPPAPDWIHYGGKYHQTSNVREVLQDPYASRADKKEFTDGWFVKSMPDLNQSDPLLADYLIYNSIWWIEFAGLKGIRHDTQPYAGQNFMQKWTCRIMQEYPNFNIVGEEWSTNPATVAKWQKGSMLTHNFGSCLPSLMDFPTQAAFKASLTEKDDWNSGFIKSYKTLSQDYLYPDPFNLVIFADNHDMDRFYRQVNKDYDLFKMGLTYFLTMRGIPQIYYGTEILMYNEKKGDHGQIREDFPGGWQADNVNAFTAKNLPAKKLEAQKFLKKLVNWRKNQPVIHTGKLMQYVPKGNGIYVYFRYNEHKSIMVILNKRKKSIRLRTNRFYERLSGFTKGRDVITGRTYKLDDLNVPKRSALILELQ